MKKVFCILSMFSIVMPAMAAISDTNKNKVVTAGFVEGAYDALNNAKQEKLTSANVTQGAGAIVTSVAASNGTVTVTRSNEVTIPVSSTSSATRANIWVE